MKWGAVLSLLVMRLAWLIELFLVNIIFINIPCTEEQRLFVQAFITAVLNSLSICSIVWLSRGSHLDLCFAQECSINSPDYGPLPQNAPGWCLAPFDPEGILRFDNGIPFFSVSLLYFSLMNWYSLYSRERALKLSKHNLYLNALNNFLYCNSPKNKGTEDAKVSCWYLVANLFCLQIFQFIDGCHHMFCGIAIWAHTCAF